MRFREALMDSFAVKATVTGYILEANGAPVICTAELQIAEKTVATAQDEALLQIMRQRCRALAVFNRWRRMGHKTYFTSIGDRTRSPA